ncbi:MAG: ABC transporter transmembrane domain-containing protein, partial [Cytophagaceae bacterium]
MNSLKYLNKYLYKYKYKLIIGILFIVFANIFATIQGPIIREVIDHITTSLTEYQEITDPEARDAFKVSFYREAMYYGLLIIGMAFISGVFLYFQRQAIIGVSRHIEYDLKNEIYRHYQTLPLNFYRQNNTGDLMARISEDVSQVRMYLGPALMYGFNLSILFIIVISYMVSVNAKLTLYTLIPLPLLSLSIFYVSNMINSRSTKIQEGLSEMSTFAQEAFSGIRVIKSFVRESDMYARFNNLSIDYRKKFLSLTRVNSFFYPLILILTGLSTIIVVYYGGREVIAGQISFGNIVE